MLETTAKPAQFGRLEAMNPEELVDLIVRAEIPLLPSEVASRESYQDRLTLNRLAFLATLCATDDCQTSEGHQTRARLPR